MAGLRLEQPVHLRAHLLGRAVFIVRRQAFDDEGITIYAVEVEADEAAGGESLVRRAARPLPHRARDPFAHSLKRTLAPERTLAPGRTLTSRSGVHLGIITPPCPASPPT